MVSEMMAQPGTLYGKTYLSHVLIWAKKYDEAEQILLVVIDSI